MIYPKNIYEYDNNDNSIYILEDDISQTKINI